MSNPISIKAPLKARLARLLLSLSLVLFGIGARAEVARIEVSEQETLSSDAVDFHYEVYHGVMHFTLDPDDPANAAITDIEYAPVNAAGQVEYAADFKLLVPSDEIANGGLLYNVNNRGGSTVPPEESLLHPLSRRGYTYLVTGWINEITPQPVTR